MMGFQFNNGESSYDQEWQSITSSFTAKNGTVVEPIKNAKQALHAFRKFDRVDFGFTGVVVSANVLGSCSV